MDFASQFPAVLPEIHGTRDPGKQRVGCRISCRLQCLEVSDSMGMEVRLALGVITSSPGQPSAGVGYAENRFCRSLQRSALSPLPWHLGPPQRTPLLSPCVALTGAASSRGSGPLTWALYTLWPPCQCSWDHCVELWAHFPSPSVLREYWLWCREAVRVFQSDTSAGPQCPRACLSSTWGPQLSWAACIQSPQAKAHRCPGPKLIRS